MLNNNYSRTAYAYHILSQQSKYIVSHIHVHSHTFFLIDRHKFISTRLRLLLTIIWKDKLSVILLCNGINEHLVNQSTAGIINLSPFYCKSICALSCLTFYFFLLNEKLEDIKGTIRSR